ncbi:MAG TPA: isocitrate lyase/phosphoenolpyruvate mutase family protein [Candidatus Binataceae bacterium]|nr:isocitrate lyase/phosphoenolpyruvate mutase family protein [Candidatus Binataceae bacterium]
MVSKSQREKAARFLRLHQGPRILVLPNAWDAASARIFEAAGFAAVATTSGGVAVSLGYPDGEAVPRDEMIDATHRIARAVDLPVSADIEAGYGRTPNELAVTIKEVIEAGAVGVNLEDGLPRGSRKPLRDIDQQVERLRVTREVAKALGLNLVINARTDVYLHRVGKESARFDETVRRCNAWHAAGADCVFVPGVADRKTIGALVKVLDGPLNVMIWQSTPPPKVLEKLGVRRASTASGPARAALTVTRAIADQLIKTGSYAGFTRNIMTHVEANQLMSNRGR